MKVIRNISFAALLALVLLSGTVKLGATPDDWCPDNCWCLGEGTMFMQVDCTIYQECADHANIPCDRYCDVVGGWGVALDTYAYGDCLSTCICMRIDR